MGILVFSSKTKSKYTAAIGVLTKFLIYLDILLHSVNPRVHTS